MKRITMATLAAVMLVAIAGASLAATAASTPRIDRREARQHARIHQGVRNGQLTRHEGRVLRRDQRHIARVERRAKADGVVTRQERRRITHAQNRENRRIYRLKHNDRTRT